MAADLWGGDPAVLDSGERLPTVPAGMALPGVFPPVQLNSRERVDGGLAHPRALRSADARLRPDRSDGTFFTLPSGDQSEGLKRRPVWSGYRHIATRTIKWISPKRWFMLRPHHGERT
jgi:hypothetical protein